MIFSLKKSRIHNNMTKSIEKGDRFYFKPHSLRSMMSLQGRAKNKEGWAAGIDVVEDDHGSKKSWSLGWTGGGYIREVYAEALSDAAHYPGRRYVVVQDPCNDSDLEIQRILPRILEEAGII